MPTPKGPSMLVIAEKLDSLTDKVETIAATVADIKESQVATDIHIKNIIGPPHLEERTMKYIDAKSEHERASFQRDLTQAQTILQLEQQNAALRATAQIEKVDSKITAVEVQAAHTEQERKENHEQNGKRFSKLERNQWMAVGALAAIEFILKFVFNK